MNWLLCVLSRDCGKSIVLLISGRIEELTRQMNLLSGNTESSIFFTSDITSNCFGACLSEVSALLELGYPREEPDLFTTSFPSPGRNSIRTRQQIRSAVHHLGGTSL